MIAVNPFGARTVGVLGLGRSGLTAAAALSAGGAHVVVWDDNADRRAQAASAGFPLEDPAAHDWSGHAALVLSPGIPLTHPEPHQQVKVARAAGIPVIGDMELFQAARPNLPKALQVAVTGTNGKSTTTALIAHIFNECEVPSLAAGNIGKAVLSLDPLPDDGAYVLEVSSYQIDLTPSLKPDIAVLLNITPDHLDRHGGMAGYVSVKARLFANQGAKDWAIVGVDDEPSAAICADLQARDRQSVIPISATRAVEGGVYVEEGTLMDATGGAPKRVGDLQGAPNLKGQHNWQNAAAAYAAVSRRVADPSHIFAAMVSFPGLPHRMERVMQGEGVLFINDSKATNQASAAKALASFDHIRWIAGGIAKEDNLDMIRPFAGNIDSAYLIGRDAGLFEHLLTSVVPTVQCGDLPTAVDRAAGDAAASGGGTVLLSPAAASQDQFQDYEDRGECFKKSVQTWLEQEGVQS